jgi:hypothetical protein
LKSTWVKVHETVTQLVAERGGVCLLHTTSYTRSLNKKILFEASQGKKQDPNSKITRAKGLKEWHKQ